MLLAVQDVTDLTGYHLPYEFSAEPGMPGEITLKGIVWSLVDRSDPNRPRDHHYLIWPNLEHWIATYSRHFRTIVVETLPHDPPWLNTPRRVLIATDKRAPGDSTPADVSLPPTTTEADAAPPATGDEPRPATLATSPSATSTTTLDRGPASSGGRCRVASVPDADPARRAPLRRSNVPPATVPHRMVFCGQAADRTGPPLYLLRVAEWIKRHRDVELFFLLLEGGPLVDEFRAHGEVVVVDEHRPAPRQAVARSILRRRLRSFGAPDLIYVNTATSVRALRLLDIGHTPVLSHVHELSVGLDFWLDPSDLALLRSASTAVLTVSQAVEVELVERHGFSPDHMERHPGFVPTDLPKRRRLRHPTTAGHPGPCGGDRRRRRSRLAQGAGHLRPRRGGDRRHASTEVHGLWLGGGPGSPLAERVRREIAESAIPDRIHLVDEHPDVFAWLAAMDVLVHPAREDAFPLVCVEAGTMGLPLVAFDNGGRRELRPSRRRRCHRPLSRPAGVRGRHGVPRRGPRTPEPVR